MYVCGDVLLSAPLWSCTASPETRSHAPAGVGGCCRGSVCMYRGSRGCRRACTYVVGGSKTVGQ
jgi:hypothetical protein